MGKSSRKRSSKPNGNSIKSKKKTKSLRREDECPPATNNYVSTSQDADAEVNKLKHSDPVLCLNLSNSLSKAGKIPDISFDHSSTSLLEKLLFPLDPKTFLTNCFRQKALCISSNDESRVSTLNSRYMFDLDVKQIFEETSSDSVFLWIRPQSNHKNKEEEKEGPSSSPKKEDKRNHLPPLESIEIQDPEMAYLLYSSSNYASYCRAPPELEQPLVYNMLKDTGIGCGHYETLNDESSATSPVSTASMGRGEVETFIGTKNHVTDWHIDFQENFTIQLSGCKKWTLKQSTLKHPLRGVTPHYKSTFDVVENQLKASRLSNSKFVFGKQDEMHNSFGEEVEIIMKAGDVLYFPAGMWHKVETMEHGVSINISLMGSNYASVVCGAIEHLLLKNDEWREVVCNRNTSVTSIANLNEEDIVVQKIDKLLGDLPEIIRDFKENGGAECIIPPVLRRAPNYVLANQDTETNETEENIDDEIDGNMKIKNKGENEFEEDEQGGDASDECMNSDVDEDDMDQIITLDTFECPGDRQYSRPSPQHKRVKNPLAIIMKLADVTSFDSHCNDHGKDDNQYILNVSYAGNEQHESSVRAVIHDETGVLELLCKIQQSKSSVETDFDTLLSDDMPLDALFHYGYFVWSEKS